MKDGMNVHVEGILRSTLCVWLQETLYSNTGLTVLSLRRDCNVSHIERAMHNTTGCVENASLEDWNACIWTLERAERSYVRAKGFVHLE